MMLLGLAGLGLRGEAPACVSFLANEPKRAAETA